MSTIKTKFSYGEEVWIMHNNKATKAEVKCVQVTVRHSGVYIAYWMLWIDDVSFTEDRVFKTKKQLVNSL